MIQSLIKHTIVLVEQYTWLSMDEWCSLLVSLLSLIQCVINMLIVVLQNKSQIEKKWIIE